MRRAATRQPGGLTCARSNITLFSWRRDPKANLAVVQAGFPAEAVECVGSGSGVRFAQFRCKVSVIDTDTRKRKTEVWGRILVGVTGKSTFRWSLI